MKSYLLKQCLQLNPYNTFRTVVRYSSIHVGQTAKLSKAFTAEDVSNFANLSLDVNPLHVNEEYAKKSRYGERIVHGALINGLVSAVMGTIMPGPGCILVNQTLYFQKPLFINENVTAEITVKLIDRHAVDCSYLCKTDDGKEILNGWAKLFVPDLNV